MSFNSDSPDRYISDKSSWIWQHPNWHDFKWQDEQVLPLLRRVRLKQGELLGKAGVVNGGSNSESALDTLLQNVISSSAIEGEQLNVQSVRSSLAKRLGLVSSDSPPVSQRSEGLAEMMMDAIGNQVAPLTRERLSQWHKWLFPRNEFSLHNIRVGELRGEEPMQVVSGRIDRPTVHFEAPPRSVLDDELNVFIKWFNNSREEILLDPLIRAAITHFWFVTLHPYDDGNGRITRALTDLALAQADSQSIRMYTMSAAILDQRKAYYYVLEKSQRGTNNITVWLLWFLETLDSTLQGALDKIECILVKTRFWSEFNHAGLMKEQVKVLNRLLDGGDNGFEQGISASQYQKVAKVSKATATRHLADLLAKGCIEKLAGGGRNTRYKITK